MNMQDALHEQQGGTKRAKLHGSASASPTTTKRSGARTRHAKSNAKKKAVTMKKAKKVAPAATGRPTPAPAILLGYSPSLRQPSRKLRILRAMKRAVDKPPPGGRAFGRSRAGKVAEAFRLASWDPDVTRLYRTPGVKEWLDATRSEVEPTPARLRQVAAILAWSRRFRSTPTPRILKYLQAVSDQSVMKLNLTSRQIEREGGDPNRVLSMPSAEAATAAVSEVRKRERDGDLTENERKKFSRIMRDTRISWDVPRTAPPVTTEELSASNRNRAVVSFREPPRCSHNFCSRSNSNATTKTATTTKRKQQQWKHPGRTAKARYLATSTGTTRQSGQDPTSPWVDQTPQKPKPAWKL